MAQNTKTIKTRVQLKSDTEEHWNLAGPKEGSNGFVPLLGELIVYLPDGAHPFCRLKVGNGSTNIVDLPFIDAGSLNGIKSYISHYQNFNYFPPIGKNDLLYIADDTQAMYYWNDRYIKIQVETEHTYIPTSSTPISGRGVAAAINSLDTSAVQNDDFSKTIYKLTVANGEFGLLTRPISIGKSNFNQALQDEFDDKASLSGADFTGNVTVPTMEPSNDSTYVATTEFVQAAINRKLSNKINAFAFRGTLGDPSIYGMIPNLPRGGYKKGDTYLVSDSYGQDLTETCEEGDLIIAIEDGPTIEAAEINEDHWIVIQRNIDNAVYRVTRQGAVDYSKRIAVFRDMDGNAIQDSGLTIRQLLNITGEGHAGVYQASGYADAYTGHKLAGTTGANALVSLEDGCLTISGDITFTTTQVITGIQEVQQ